MVGHQTSSPATVEGWDSGSQIDKRWVEDHARLAATEAAPFIAEVRAVLDVCRGLDAGGVAISEVCTDLITLKGWLANLQVCVDPVRTGVVVD